MGNLLFSPSGRIGPGEFMKGAIILIVVAVILSIPSLIGLPAGLVTALSLLSLVTLWCWVVLWVKRYHDGGKSGWTCLLPIIVYIILALVVYGALMGGSFMEIINATSNGASEAEIEELTAAMTAKTGVPVLIASTVMSFAISFLFNKMIKQDMHDNQFGPHRSVGETFS